MSYKFKSVECNTMPYNYVVSLIVEYTIFSKLVQSKHSIINNKILVCLGTCVVEFLMHI